MIHRLVPTSALLRLVRLDLEGPITGYAYRDHPERFELHIHRFLDDIQKREYR